MNEKFNSEMRSEDISLPTLMTLHKESEKKLLSINKSLERIKDRSQIFIYYCSALLSVAFTFLTLAFSSNFFGLGFLYALIPLLYFICFILFALYKCFKTMGLSYDVASEGFEPQNYLNQDQLGSVDPAKQLRFTLFRQVEAYQDKIDKNHVVMTEKSQLINEAFELMKLSFILPFYVFLFCLRLL